MARRPFARTAVLVVLRGEAACGLLQNRPNDDDDASPCPALDALAAAGVSTELVQPPALAADAFSVVPYTAAVAALRELVKLDVRGRPREKVDSALSSEILALPVAKFPASLIELTGIAAPPALVVVDAGESVAAADALVSRLLPVALPGDLPELGRAPLLLGAVVADECWVGAVPPPPPPAGVHVPAQSAEVGRGDARCFVSESERAKGGLRPVGIVAWAGEGLTRVDAVLRFDGCQRGGDGQLLPSQMLAEVLTKVGLRPKFGA